MLALGTALGNLSLAVLHNAGVARAEAAARLGKPRGAHVLRVLVRVRVSG